MTIRLIVGILSLLFVGALCQTTLAPSVTRGPNVRRRMLQNAADGDVDSVKKILDIPRNDVNWPDLNLVRTCNGTQVTTVNATAVHRVTACNPSTTKDMVQLLLSHNADVNLVEGFLKRTPLMLAALNGNTDVVNLLIDAYAEFEMFDTNNATALMLAAENHHIDTVKALLDGGADVNTKSSDGKTALLVAAIANDKPVVDLLKSQGASIADCNNLPICN